MPSIGPIQLAAPFCQAGLAGYSDRAMRLVARRRGCAYAVTEALLDVILVNGGEGLRKSIDINDEDHPIAGQIIGSEPATMARAAGLLQQAGYDVIDLNFACPVKKIKNKSRGGHMLRDVQRGIDVMKAARDALPSETPMTVSLRRAFDDSAESEDRFEQLFEGAFANGYVAARVHARTVEQKYQGRANWPMLRELKRRFPHRTILGSGDVFTAEDAERMRRETGVDIVWIARGAIGNPWIFGQAEKLRQAAEEGPRAEVKGPSEGPERGVASSSLGPQPFDLGPSLLPPSIMEQRAALAEHFGIAMQIHGESFAGRRMRKMGIKYSRFHPEATAVKAAFIDVQSLRDWTAVLDRFYATEGPGVWPAVNAADEVNADADLQSCVSP